MWLLRSVTKSTGQTTPPAAGLHATTPLDAARELGIRDARPEGNGVAERFIRTVKENLLWVRSFETIEELRLALLEFQRTYNEQWMLANYDYRSPAQVRRDFDGLDAVA